MGKLILFWLLWMVTGNPFISILLILLVLYLLDHRFIGMFPSITRPIRRNRRIRQLEQTLRLNPHNTSDKRELARLRMEKKQFQKAVPLLEEALQSMPDSAEVKTDLGICRLRLGQKEQGEQLILEALEHDPRVYYGEPYLRLAEAFSITDKEKALRYLEHFRGLNSSSSEAYYRLGRLYDQLNRKQEARHAFEEAIEIYRSLPKYKKRTERPWALKSSFRLGLAPSPRTK